MIANINVGLQIVVNVTAQAQRTKLVVAV